MTVNTQGGIMGYQLNFRVLSQYSDLFLNGIVLTAKISLGAMVISFFLAVSIWFVSDKSCASASSKLCWAASTSACVAIWTVWRFFVALTLASVSSRLFSAAFSCCCS